MIKELNADNFERNNIYSKIFNNVMNCFIDNYFKMVEDNESLKYSSNSLEDLIRNYFIKNYVRKNKSQFGLENIRFEVETGTINEQFHNEGYIDIQVINIYNYGDEDEYFAFECKRLKNNEKNKDYIDKGVIRFVNNKYAYKMPLSGMIGFVEESNISINAIINDIKIRLDNSDNVISNLKKILVRDNFEHSYQSKHKRLDNNTPIELYHLLFDIKSLC